MPENNVKEVVLGALLLVQYSPINIKRTTANSVKHHSSTIDLIRLLIYNYRLLEKKESNNAIPVRIHNSYRREERRKKQTHSPWS